jgi:hypothetical protein
MVYGSPGANTRRILVALAAAAASAVVVGWWMGMMDFVAPDLVRAMRGGRCGAFCGVLTSWVLGAGFLGGLLGGGLALALYRPGASRRSREQRP